MDNFIFIQNGKECQKYIFEKIIRAQKIIFISSWHIDLTYLIDKKTPLYKILLNKCYQGINVYIMTSIAPQTECYDNNQKIINKINHPNFHIKILDMENSSVFSYLISKLHHVDSRLFPFRKCCKRLFHQRYFNVDNIHCMLGGADMDDDLNCSFLNNIPNKNEYYWIEYGIVFKPPKEFLDYCINNYITGGKSAIKSKYFYGNFFYKNTEYNYLKKLIKDSKYSIFIENQWVFSTPNTKNNIIQYILDKCVSNKNMEFILITNLHFIDACHKNIVTKFSSKINCKIYKYIFKRYFYKTLDYIFNYLRSRNIPVSRINKQIKIYTVSDNILLHSKNIIIDHNKMLYGTSNMWDRSYYKGYDIELSIFLKGPKVKQIEKKIIQQYKGNSYTLDGSKNIKRIYLNYKTNIFTIIKKFIIIFLILFIIYYINKIRS
jgi:phosphatidylserine/phosphatidylglycerophosphate/cardiolipin synthase-like enzyme